MNNELDSHKKFLRNNVRIITYLLSFITAVIVVYILMALRVILIPITIAIFLTYLFHPLLMILTRNLKLPKVVSLFLIFILNFAVFYLIAVVMASNFENFSIKVEYYFAKLSIVLQDMLRPFDLTITELSSMLNFEMEEFNLGLFFKELFDAGILQNAVTSFSSILGDFFIVMFFWIFMILGKTKFEERLKYAFRDRVKSVEKNLNSIDDQLQSYILLKTILSLSTGILYTIVLWLFGVDFAVFWGMLAFILNYIPNIGSMIATIFPLLISLLEYGFGLTVIMLAVILIGIQTIIGNILEPRFMGSRMDLSPVFVLFSLIFWGWIWGIVGMFLAIPIAALIKIFCSNIDALKPIAIVLGNQTKPAV